MLPGESGHFVGNQDGLEGLRLESSHPLRTAIAGILEKRRPEILEQYHEAYCQYIYTIKKKKRDIEHLRIVCMQVKKRFSNILDRFINFLQSEDRGYDLSESEQDEEYALRFVVPPRGKNMNSHNVVMTTESFYKIATSAVLAELNPAEYSTSTEGVINIMNALIYFTFEDLWASSVAGFRAQHSVIQQLLSKLMQAHEEERQNLWREIHDELLQILAVIPLRIDIIIEELARKDIPAMKKEIDGIKRLTQETTQKIRNLCHGFNFIWVEKKGFALSLRTFARLFEGEFRIPIALHICPQAEGISGYPGVVLFRMLQEGLYNVARHSKATYARIVIEVSDMSILSTIEDNGVGFDVQNAMRKSLTLQHLGLMFMKERAMILNGSLEIDSERDVGTKVRISVPLSSFEENSQECVEVDHGTV